MPILKSPKLNSKNLILLIAIVIILAVLGLVKGLVSNKSASPSVLAQSCWQLQSPLPPGGCEGGCDSGGAAGGGSSEGAGSCSCTECSGDGY